MKRFLLILLTLLLLGLPGCGKAQDSSGVAETIYYSDTSSQDCYLCGGHPYRHCGRLGREREYPDHPLCQRA